MEETLEERIQNELHSPQKAKCVIAAIDVEEDNYRKRKTYCRIMFFHSSGKYDTVTMVRQKHIKSSL